jgi:hypothetical protein
MKSAHFSINFSKLAHRSIISLKIDMHTRIQFYFMRIKQQIKEFNSKYKSQ